ncbi:glycine-rich cell wall structural protein 2-like [Miscanthus floridulus]|uniref:glycine-rich cell wall structural protein 2-like n=1 Tax=Miscanthus floridulus TaxID=154761 RepID=UPI003459AF1D
MTTPPHPPQRPPLHATTTYTYTYTSSFTMKRGKGIPGHRRDVGGHRWGEGRGRGDVKGPGRGTSSSSLLGLLSSPVPLLLFLPFSHLLLRTGAGMADSVDRVGGWRGVLLLLRWPADGVEVLLLLGAGRPVGVGGRAAGVGHLRRVEASGGVGLLRWPAPPPSSSGGQGPGAHGVAVAGWPVAGWRWLAGGRGWAAWPRWGTSGGLRRAAGWGSSGGLLLHPPPLAAGGRGRAGWLVAGWRWRGRAGWRSRGGQGRGPRARGVAVATAGAAWGGRGAAELGGAVRGG